MSKEYEAFSHALEQVLSVSHDEIKRRESEEHSKRHLAPRKQSKNKKRKAKKPSASGHAADEKD